jgi:uncharacterized protein (TIGR00255 family)
MIRSMTGFGRAEHKSGKLQIGVEIRCVNHRYADLRVKLPRVLAGMEEDLRQKLSGAINRGRADALVSVSGLESEAPVEVNHSLISAYLRAGSEVARKHRLEGAISLQSVLGLPGAVSVRGENGGVTRVQQKAVQAAFEAALKDLARTKDREGKHLGSDLNKRLKQVEKDRAEIAKRSRGSATKYAKRLHEKLAGIEGADQIDSARMAQEVALLASRADITEELVRLQAHLKQAGVFLKNGKGSIGKKLDFLVQEMHREANTINSKSEDLNVLRLALDIKAELEKIREQVQNIE